MFKNIKSRLKSFLNDDIFSSLSVLAFNKYKKNYSNGDFLNAYELSLYANRAISKRAEKVGEIDFVLKQGDKVIEDNPILDLLAKPNPNFTGTDFWALYQKYYDIFGEVYIIKDDETRIDMGMRKMTNSLIILRSDLVKPYFNKTTGELEKVELKDSDRTVTYLAEEIIYIHNPNPANPLRGESLLRSGVRQIETAMQIDEYHSKILENGGRVEGVFKFKTGGLTRKQLEELKDSYQEQYGNASKAGLPMFLSGDANYERLGLDPAELAYLETKNVTLNDILMLTGVPKALLGVTSDETFSNADASIRIFLNETINPLLKTLTDNLNESLVDENFELSYVDPTPEDKEEKRKDLETGSNINAMTINEKREQIGLDPIADGDVILIPMNLVPYQKQEPVAPTKKKKVKVAHPLRSVDTRRIYHALQLKRLDNRQKQMLDVIKDYFKGQEKRLVEKLQSQKRFRKKDLLGEIFNLSLEVGLAKESVLPLMNELLKQSAEEAKEVAGSDWDYQETADIQNWLDKKTTIFAEQINSTTFKKLKSEFQLSLDAGESRKELVKRIEGTYGDISKSRAETIARTEVHASMQYGTLQGYKQAGMQIKIWVWAPGTKGGVRDSHQAMDGEERPIDTAFSNGQMTPGEGDAKDVINCQCSI